MNSSKKITVGEILQKYADLILRCGKDSLEAEAFKQVYGENETLLRDMEVVESTISDIPTNTDNSKHRDALKSSLKLITMMENDIQLAITNKVPLVIDNEKAFDAILALLEVAKKATMERYTHYRSLD